LSRDPHYAVVGDSGDPRAAIAEIGALRPDVVLLDISMPGLSGIDAISMIRDLHPTVQVVTLPNHEGQTFGNQALAAGADGRLSKDSDQAELLLAIEAVRRGNPFISPKVARSLLHRGGPVEPRAPIATRIESLTPREREVFQLLALGKSNKEIARA